MNTVPEWLEDLMSKAVELSHEEGLYREMFVRYGMLMVKSLPPEHQNGGPVYELLLESLISLASTAALFTMAHVAGRDLQEVHDHILRDAQQDESMMQHVEKLVDEATAVMSKSPEQAAKEAWSKWSVN